TFAQLKEKQDHPLHGFTCGIGLAHGIAMAGRIGNVDQFKVGVFGPVVNLASRMESMTKPFGVPILVDAEVAKLLEQATVRCPTVARVIPAGMSNPVTVSELLLPAAEGMDLREVLRLDYEAALEEFIRGRWDRVARKLLKNDGPSEFLRKFMAEH